MKIILSCTTTYERRNIFYYSIQSLLKQSIKPDLFLVNLSKDSYLQDSGFSDVPAWLKDERVTINWVKNTGPYRKLLPCLDHAGEDDLIITVDDDVLYDQDWLEKLFELSKKNPDSIVCSRAKKMTKNIFGRWKNYGHWDQITRRSKGMMILPTSGAGAVYKKKLLDSNFLTDIKFLEIAPTTDDLWFREASRRKETPVAVFPDIGESNIMLKHQFGLNKQNFIRSKTQSKFLKLWLRFFQELNNYLGVRKSLNDINWERITEYSNRNPELS